MWLPKDERRLLRYSYHLIGSPDGEESFELDELVRCLACRDAKELRKRKDDGQRRSKDIVKAVNDRLDERNRVKVALTTLKHRGLITLTEYSGDRQVKRIGLTLQGFDLARRYSSWWARSGEWFEEYRNHWIWLIVSFFGGVVGALLINWLTRGAGGE